MQYEDLSGTLVKHIEKLQTEANSSYETYPKHQCLLPNDAIYLVRLHNLKAVCDQIEDLVAQSGKDLKTVIQRSIAPNASAIKQIYSYVDEALDVIIRDFG